MDRDANAETAAPVEDDEPADDLTPEEIAALEAADAAADAAAPDDADED